MTRALDVLFFVSGAAAPVPAARIAAGLGLPRPTVYRLIDTLMANDLLAKSERGIVATPKLFFQASGGQSMLKFANVVERHLGWLVQETSETAALQVRVGSIRRCILEIEGDIGVRWSHGVGYTAPVTAGAVGHVLMTGMAESELASVLVKGRLRRMASGTVSDPAELRARVELARRRGWSMSVSEHEEGVVAIAAPVWCGEHLAGAVNLSAPAARAKKLREAVPHLVRVGASASDEWSRVCGVARTG